MTFLVSVIIPVYNVEQYLEKCLESVVHQTYENLEIICVNDCSPDKCAEILEKYAKQDSRIKIVNREKNGGLSAARNSGLDAATGEYVYFLDSDDWIDLDYIEKMVEAIEKSGCDIVFNANIMTEEKDKASLLKKIPRSWLNSCFEGNDALDKSQWSAWSHFYKRVFLEKNNLRFSEGYIYEDVLFQHMATYYANKVFIFFGSSYHYLIRENSIMAIKGNIIQKHIKIWRLVEEFYRQFCPLEELEIKLFEPYIFIKINNEEEFESAKGFLLSLKEYLKQQYYLFTDFDRFVIKNIITSDSYATFKKKLGKFPLVMYTTREKLQRQKRIKVSVIVPVYNIEKYLEKCLNSICSQTLEDIEIICVNDCSPDNSLDILQEYAMNDNRIKIINLEENQGLAVARNEGIKQARGEYIAFVDSDDAISLDFCEKLYNATCTNKYDLILSSTLRKQPGEQDVFIYDNQLVKKHNNPLFFTSYFCSAIYKKAIIDTFNILFPPKFFSEDNVFVSRFLPHVSSFEYVPDVYYIYFRRTDSLNSPVLSDEKVKFGIMAYANIIDNLNSAPDIINNNRVGYEYNCCQMFFRYLDVLLRNNSKQARKNVVKMFIDTYKKIKFKDLLLQELKKKYPLMGQYLSADKFDEVENMLVNSASKKELVILNLRYRLEKK